MVGPAILCTGMVCPCLSMRLSLVMSTGLAKDILRAKALAGAAGLKVQRRLHFLGTAAPRSLSAFEQAEKVAYGWGSREKSRETRRATSCCTLKLRGGQTISRESSAKRGAASDGLQFGA
eukprot:g11144.t1